MADFGFLECKHQLKQTLLLSKYTQYHDCLRPWTKTGMTIHAWVYFRGKNSTQNEHGDICFLNDYKFLYKNSFQRHTFFVSVVALCDIFILGLIDFLALLFRQNRF